MPTDPIPSNPPIADNFEHDLSLTGKLLADLRPPGFRKGKRLDWKLWQPHRASIANRALAVFGKFPGHSSHIEVRWGHSKKLPLYTRHEVSFSGEKSEWISAFLLIPKKLKKPAPAVLCPHPTHIQGKSAGAIPGVAKDGFQYAWELAERGCITLVWDHFTLPPRAPKGSEYDSREFERKHPTWSPLGKAIWDAMRSLDFLETLSEVDVHRIGSIGLSLGGNTTFFTSAFDARIHAAVCACGCSTFRSDRNLRYNWVRDQGNYHYMPRLANWLDRGKPPPFEFHEIAAMIAPRPLLMFSGYHDEWCPGSAIMGEFTVRVHDLYDRLGKAEAFSHIHHGEHHSFGPVWREMAYA
ncbi:MAG: acetylxylan esterase, partial [Verrucomicrobia bacterium]|nr:acetylxylan esterase [Verrucomicrobiota bacterium]